MKGCTLTVFMLILNGVYAQNVHNIYREDFELFFKKDKLNARYDVLSLVDSLPPNFEDGEYHFYDVNRKDSTKRIMYRHTYGQFKNGKKEGEFVSETNRFNKKIMDYEKYWQQVITYKGGQKDGVHKEYYMSYQYNRKKELINELATFSIYIEYKENQYDGFYMILTDFDDDDIMNRGYLTIRYYEEGIMTKSMKYDGRR